VHITKKEYVLLIYSFLYFNLLFITRSSNRTLSVYDVEKLGEPLSTEILDISPAILVIQYDEGTSTVFLTGRV